MLYSCEESISRTKPVHPIEKFPSLVISSESNNIVTLSYPITILVSVNWSLREGQKQKNMSNFEL